MISDEGGLVLFIGLIRHQKTPEITIMDVILQSQCSTKVEVNSMTKYKHSC